MAAADERGAAENRARMHLYTCQASYKRAAVWAAKVSVFFARNLLHDAEIDDRLFFKAGRKNWRLLVSEANE